MARDTTTGSDYEAVIRSCIERSCRKNGMSAISQKIIGEKPGGGKHRVDWELTSLVDSDIRGLVSCKFQKTSGTAEEKIAYEVIKLLYAMKINFKYRHSWIILGGEGWSPGIKKFAQKEIFFWIPQMEDRIEVLTTEQLLTNGINLSGFKI